MKIRTAASLMKTIVVLKLADSLIPITRNNCHQHDPEEGNEIEHSGDVRQCCEHGDIRRQSRRARRLPDVVKEIEMGARRGGELSGRLMPKLWRKKTTVPDQPEATVAAPKAYSRIKSQPMIQAKISPRVA
jgi:hypothetical protein